MSWLKTFLRRALWFSALTGAGSAAYTWWRARTRPPEPEPPQWPPLDATAAASASPVSAPPSAAPPGAPTATSPAPATLVGTAEDRPSGNGDATWVAPDNDGSCPITHPIKANDNSGIFHVPGGRFYDRTQPERCYSSAEAATADGYRQAKN